MGMGTYHLVGCAEETLAGALMLMQQEEEEEEVALAISGCLRTAIKPILALHGFI